MKLYHLFFRLILFAISNPSQTMLKSSTIPFKAIPKVQSINSLTYVSPIKIDAKRYASKLANKTPEEILGVSKNASLKDINNAYRKLSMKYHPDTGGSKEDFQALSNAYNVLKNKSTHDTNSSNYSDMDDDNKKLFWGFLATFGLGVIGTSFEYYIIKNIENYEFRTNLQTILGKEFVDKIRVFNKNQKIKNGTWSTMDEIKYQASPITDFFKK